MQGSLLVMCILWTFRQRRLGIDEFGNPATSPTIIAIEDGDTREVPGLVESGAEGLAIMRVALEVTLESTASADDGEGSPITRLEGAGEEIPLLGSQTTHLEETRRSGGWLKWLSRLTS